MKIGVLGGGQLGKMFALAGYPLGFDFAFFDPDPTCCARLLAPTTHANFSDAEALTHFARTVDVLTYENENIPLPSLVSLAEHQAIYPPLEAIRLFQDRWLEKSFVVAETIPTAEFCLVESVADAHAAATQLQFPFLLKSRRFGYDGKGQYRIKTATDLAALTEAELAPGFIAEKHIAFQREFSLIAVKGLTGELAFYDVCENQHEAGILMTTRNKPNDPLFATAKKYVTALIDKLDYVGVLAVEFFDVDGQAMLNEVAPRVHNSGHWTIEGAYTSQFENHLRAITGLPLGDTSSRCLVEMQNLIGVLPDRNTTLLTPHAYWHDYGKSPRPGRKLGHVTKLLS